MAHMFEIIDDGERALVVLCEPTRAGVMRDGIRYCWRGEPRPNRHDREAWIEYNPSPHAHL